MAQLAWSTDHGRTWTWSDWKFTTSFGSPTFLNFGRNYVGARDGYVYVYSSDADSANVAADRFVLARASKNRIKDRAAYEFFVKLDAKNNPVWTKEIEKRAAYIWSFQATIVSLCDGLPFMTNSDIARLRLNNQRIAGTRFERPADVVAWLGAVQAQDYLGSLWAVGLRMRSAVEADIEQALANRTIIRTWPMRGTLHFVAAADIRWMLELLTPRIVAGNARRLHRQFGLDEATFARSKDLFVRALEGGKQLTRTAMYEVLEAGGISTASQRGLHILWRVAQDGLICFGAREGKQQTFALLEEWAPMAKRMARDESLAELARRYFTSHGPATLQDFAWWSGLTTADARTGLEMAKRFLAQEVSDGQTYWLASSMPAAKDSSPTAYLLPVYDEYTVAYKDRSAVLNPEYAKHANYGHGIFNPTIVVDGQVVGTWKRTLKKDALVITPSPFAKLKRAETRAFAEAASRYGEFLGASVVERSGDDNICTENA